MIRNCSFKDRIVIYAIDYIFCVLLYLILMMFLMVFLHIFNLLHYVSFDVLNVISITISMYIFPLMKDLFFENGSFAKKIKKVKLIDSQTEKKPTIKKLILRNIFFPIIGIDLLFSLIRFDCLSLSDLITKTRVVYEIDPDMVEDTRD